MDVYDLLARAQDCLDQFPPASEMAGKFYAKAVELAPENVDCLDSKGEFEAEFGDPEQARALFLRSAELAPGVNSAKYFALGQLSSGQESVDHYRTGLKVQAEEPADGEEQEMQQDRAASAQTSIAEVYMTDLCDEPGAQQACEAALQAALAAKPGHFEALVALATLRKTVGAFEQALQIANECVEQVSDLGDCDLEERPPREARIALVETLLDLKGEKAALTLLHDLLEEDEEDVKTWYLLACAHHGEEEDDAADECLEKARLFVKALGPECVAAWAPRFECLAEGLKVEMTDE